MHPVSSVQKKDLQGISSDDLLVGEEPLEIRLGFGSVDSRSEERVAVTMRTPGDDHELALGFLFTEGIIKTMDEVLRVEHCQQVKQQERGNVIRIELHPNVQVDSSAWQRNFYTTSSCGVCGKSSIDSVRVSCTPLNNVPHDLPIKVNAMLTELPDRMRKAQVLFEHTGGIHAAALFNLKAELLTIFEDVGRHNAVDKVVGHRFRNNQEFSDSVLVVSGRAGFELVQKACVAGIPAMASVGAPSSLAVELAAEHGLLLYGFVRNGKANQYTQL